MAQQLIGLGAAANDRQGDPWRGGGLKINEMFTELYAGLGSSVFVTQESDFPIQDATTITLAGNTRHVISADFTTTKSFICSNGSSITGFDRSGNALTYSGVGSMFAATDAANIEPTPL